MLDADPAARPSRPASKKTGSNNTKVDEEEAAAKEQPAAATARRSPKATDEEVPREAASGEGIGRLISDDDVLLRG